MSQSFKSVHSALVGVWVGLCLLGGSRSSGSAEDLLPPGFRPRPLGVHALVGGKVVPKPGESLEGATIVIRDGRILALGKELTPPADARVWDMKGLTIYAGFIEPYIVQEASNEPPATASSELLEQGVLTSGALSFYGTPGQKSDRGNPAAGYEVARITPEYRVVRDYVPREKGLAPLRELGFTAGLMAPGRGVVRGTSALVALSDEDPNETVLKPDVFQHLVFDVRSGEARVYPSSLMGVIAAIRQSFFDAQHYALDQADYAKKPQSRRRPEFDPGLEALRPAAAGKMPVLFEPGSALMVDRAAQLARELGLQFAVVSCEQEWRRPDLAKSSGATFIVPLAFPTLPKLPEEADWQQVSLDALRAWDWAPENAALLRQQGLEVALTTYGLTEKQKFRANLRLALDRGLSETDALAGLTTVPAKLCGVEAQLGTIEPGKLANLTVVAGESYFDPEAKVREVWIDGRIYRGAAEAAKPAKAQGKPVEERASSGTKEAPEKAAPGPETAAAGKANAQGSPETAAESRKGPVKGQDRELQKTRLARSPLAGRGPLAEPKALLIEHATIWTCGPEGKLEDTDILMVGGKIRAIGKGLGVRSDYEGPPLVIDGRGLHVTPGLIDCHSHTAILGAVNESSLPSTAMVRISDVLNSETVSLHEQLAGGVTAINILHGSANPIGGQSCLIKLRDGASPSGLIFQAGPPGIKFALGENVKQSGAGERYTTRFPQTRMGVQTLIANRFTAAREYVAVCDQAKNGGVPPRRNLELEALGEILQGHRWIHCHSYRQDEILMLIRLMDRFGVRVGTFQHVLEGYKVADEIARHGAGASSFSDWWAYKFEVYDAIPYNGSLMRDRGVLVSFNSDSSELARRLYLEAAKAVKYGGTPEVEALKFVTINSAKQLHVDQFIGSLESGKDADFALWSKAPLDFRTVCLQTWVDGKKYFDRALAAERAAKLAKERDELVAKARKAARSSSRGESADNGSSFFRVALEHEFDGVDRRCAEEEE